jgi:phage terminase Nu1 subunit (DNA packaging protein)
MTGLPSKTGPNRYKLAPTVHAYVKHLREKAAARAHHLGAGGDSLTSARARLTQAQAAKAETALEIQRGNLIHRQQIADAWSGIMREVRAGVLAIPAQAASRMTHLTNTETATLERLCREALERLAEMPADGVWQDGVQALDDTEETPDDLDNSGGAESAETTTDNASSGMGGTDDQAAK